MEGILLQKYADRNGRCIAILFKSIGVRGRYRRFSWRMPYHIGCGLGRLIYQSPLQNFSLSTTLTLSSAFLILGAETKKTYTTTTERKSFGEPFWPQRKTFQAGGRYNPPPQKKKKENHIYHQNLSSVDPIFHIFGKEEKFLTGAGRCMLSFFPVEMWQRKQAQRTWFCQCILATCAVSPLRPTAPERERKR